MLDDDLEFEDLDYPDLDALEDQLARSVVEPDALRARVVEVVEELRRIRFRFEVIEDEARRLPDVKGRLTILDQLARAQHGVPKCTSMSPNTSGTVATWEARIRFELSRWDQLPLEEAQDALARLERYAGEQAEASEERGDQLEFVLE